MKIPKYVQDSIEKSSKAFVKARKHERIVKDWLDKQGFETDDSVRDHWIDNVEYGNGTHEDFIEFMKYYRS